MTYIVAVSNQKGGVGKTTTAIHLAVAMATMGRRVLLVDLDSQANATTGLNIEEQGGTTGTYAAMTSVPGQYKTDWIRHTAFPNLSVLPGSLELAGLELELAGGDDPRNRLRTYFKSIEDRYDCIIIDCPPALGLLSVNALIAADAVLTPTPPEHFALDGLSRLADTVNRLRESGLSTVKGPFMLTTMMQPWSREMRQRVETMRAAHGSNVLISEVPRNELFVEAAERGLPVFALSPEGETTAAYATAAAELLLLLEGQNAQSPEILLRMTREVQGFWMRHYAPENSGEAGEAEEMPMPVIPQKGKLSQLVWTLDQYRLHMLIAFGVVALAVFGLSFLIA